MKDSAFTNSGIFRYTTMLVAASLTISVFIIGRTFLIPFAWGLLLALASVRMLDKLEYKLKIKRVVLTLSFVFLVLIVVILIFNFFVFEIRRIIVGMPEMAEEVGDLLHGFFQTLHSYGLPAPDRIGREEIQDFVAGQSKTITEILGGLARGLGKIVLVAIYLFFLLFYRDNYLQYMTLRDKTRKNILEKRKRFNDILDVVNNFLYGLLIVTLIMAVMLYILFLIIGLKFALFFAVLVALLTLIPYIGIPVGMIVVVLFASITNDGLVVPLLAVGVILISNIAQENVFKPIIIGDKIKLNAFMIFASVIVGGLIWGVSGMILFMPLVGVVKLLLENNESTKPVAVLFAQLPKDVRHQFHKEIRKGVEKEIEGQS
jgi:predicted PurR-regulated permease PerM